MIDKNEIIKMAQHVFKRSAGVPDKKLMHPRREWAIGLLLFLAILVSGSTYTATSFNRFRELDTNNGEANVNIPRYQGDRVSAVLTDYQARTAAYKDLTAEVPVLVESSSSSTTATTTLVTTEEMSSTTESSTGLEDEIIGIETVEEIE